MPTSYGTPVDITPAAMSALANAAACQTAFQDNGTNDDDDAHLQVRVSVGAGTSAEPKSVLIWAYSSDDDGTTYSDAATGVAGAITLQNDPPNLRYVGSIWCATASTTYRSDTFSIAAAFGGFLPERWGIVLQNRTGFALATTSAGNNTIKYNRIRASAT